MDLSRAKNIGMKRSFIVIGLVVGLVLTGKMALQTARESQHQSLMNEGIQTCFTRVHQTFTARMLGTGAGEYLTRSFLDTTSRCFSEVVQLADAQFTKTISELPRLTNTLSAEVHLFQERINSNTSAFSEGQDQRVFLNQLSTRFENLEKLRNESLQLVDQRAQKLSNVLTTVRGAFFVIAFCLLVFLAFEFFMLRKEAAVTAEIEKDAQDILEKNEMSTLRVQEVIRRALVHKNYIQCESLFSQFQQHQNLSDKEAGYRKKEEQVHFFPLDDGQLEQKIDQLWEAADRPERDLVVYEESFQSKMNFDMSSRLESESKITRTGVELSVVVENLAEMLASQFQAQGLELEMNLDDKIRLAGDEESATMLIFQAINSILPEAQDQQRHLISIDSIALGNVAVVTIEINAGSFDHALIQSQLGLLKLDAQFIPLEIRQCLDSAPLMDAKFSFDNLYDDQGKTCGRMVKLTFRQGEQLKPTGIRVQSVKKATKRELLQEFSLEQDN